MNADAAHPNGCICVKGTAAPEMVSSPDRLRYPMKRTRPKGDADPGWVRISWDEALDLVATRLLEIKAQYGAEAVVFGRSTPAGGSSSDFIPWLQRLVRGFGSPNIMSTTYICNWHHDLGTRYTYGVGTPLPDYDHTGCVLLWGFNPQASWPAHALRISRARARGARIIVIDPRRSGMVDKADLWLRVRPGGDGALALAMIHVLLEEELYDASFVRNWTNGPFLVREDTQRLLTEHDLDPTGDAETYFVWDEQSGGPVSYHVDRGYARDDVTGALSGTFSLTLAGGATVECRPAFDWLREQAADFAPEHAEELTWVPAAEVREAVRLFATAKPSSYFTWTGLEQRSDAMMTNRAVSIFYALTGQFDSPGSNVLFATTATNPVNGPELLPPEQAARRLGLAERPLGPASDGNVRAIDVYNAILTERPYPVKALVSFGGDPLVGQADPLLGKAALEALDFHVHVDLFANPTSSFADLLLPAATCWERGGLMPTFSSDASTTTWVQLRDAVVPPQHESRADLDIIFDLATRLGLGEQFFNGDVEAAYNYQLAPAGITVEQLREQPMGMRAPGQTHYQKYASVDPQTGQPRGFHTPTRKVEIYSTAFAGAGYPPLPVYEGPVEPPGDGAAEEYPLRLTFSRLVQFRDEGDRNIPRLRHQAREPFLDVHPSVAANAGVNDGDWVFVQTASGRVRLKARLNASLHPRVVATQYGWWQACQGLDLPGYPPFEPEGANVNLLVPSDVADPISGSIPHRSQRCRISAATAPAAAQGV